MSEISKARADELNAAWQAATDVERLTLNRVEWFSADETTYFEIGPTKLEISAAKRIAALEAALREIAEFAQDVAAADRDMDMKVIEQIARKALGVTP